MPMTWAADLTIPAGLQWLEFESEHSDFDQFSFNATAESVGVVILVDHPDPAQRLEPGSSRFGVYFDGDGRDIYTGDDWAEACRIALEASKL